MPDGLTATAKSGALPNNTHLLEVIRTCARCVCSVDPIYYDSVVCGCGAPRVPPASEYIHTAPYLCEYLSTYIRGSPIRARRAKCISVSFAVARQHVYCLQQAHAQLGSCCMLSHCGRQQTKQGQTKPAVSSDIRPPRRLPHDTAGLANLTHQPHTPVTLALSSHGLCNCLFNAPPAPPNTKNPPPGPNQERCGGEEIADLLSQLANDRSAHERASAQCMQQRVPGDGSIFAAPHLQTPPPAKTSASSIPVSSAVAQHYGARPSGRLDGLLGRLAT